MTDDREKLARQMHEIGDRYLRRTLGELEKLRQLVPGAGDPAKLKEIEHLAHKIHGSGAMFGFDAVSTLAGTIETLASGSAQNTGLPSELEQQIAALTEQVQAAARERGIA
jgi:HPt (histidine-containing phosphotransfer) domain-containing protein